MKEKNNKYPSVDEYVTLAGEGHAEFIERRSRFIGHAAHISTEREALDFIARIRHEYADATHNVYAYMIKENNIARYSDDNEPQGTAGIPTLDVIKKTGFTDAVIVVTRYFGGILLGAGGLVRAYSAAAKAGVDAAGIAHFKRFTEFSLKLGYSDYNRLQPILSSDGIKNDSSEFAADVFLKLAIDFHDYETLVARIVEATSGRAFITKIGERFDF